jgi:predicted DNA-binding transcriptional regulator AlpA
VANGCKTPPTQRPQADRPPADRPPLSDRDVAERLRMSIPELYRAATVGNVPPPAERGTTWHWRAEDLDEWLAAGCPVTGPDGKPSPAEAQSVSPTGTGGHEFARGPGDEQRSAGLMSYQEAMKLTGLKKTALYTLFEQEPGLGHRAGPRRGRIFFYRTAVERYLREGRQRPAKALPRPAAPRPGPRSAAGQHLRLRFLG